MRRCCSPLAAAVAAAACAALAAATPALMACLLRHMMTAPGQSPWPHGRQRLIDVGGLPAQALYSAERVPELQSRFVHRDGDTWVVSYVKSGTTWAIGILAALHGHPAASYAGNLQKTTVRFCPQPELPDLGWGEQGFGHSIEQLNAWPSPRGFKSHWPSRDHVARNGKAKFIYLMRNAQDQMISHWNQVWGMGFHYGTESWTYEGGWHTFFEDWINGNVENGSWFDHVASWWARRDDPDVMLLRYEDLKADSTAATRRIASFMGMAPVSEEKLADVVNVTSFENMKRADQGDAGLKFMRWLGVLKNTHIRKGATGGDATLFTASQLAALEQQYITKLQPLGVPREYVLLA